MIIITKVVRQARNSLVILLVFAAMTVAVASDRYVVDPSATAETKASVSSGKSPSHGYPEIVSTTWTTTHMKPGSLFEATVVTSSNVVAVGGQYKKWSFGFERVGPNRFHVAYRVPWLPPFLIGHWPLDVFARTADGVEVHESYDLTYGYF